MDLSHSLLNPLQSKRPYEPFASLRKSKWDLKRVEVVWRALIWSSALKQYNPLKALDTNLISAEQLSHCQEAGIKHSTRQK